MPPQSILSTLKNAASELQIGHLLKPDSFSLEETILTIDILKPNMDIYADCSRSWNELQRQLMEFQHSFLLQPILTNFQLQCLIRGMLIGLLNWIHGASIHRTLFCCPLLLRHREVANPILSIFSKLIGCISEEFTKAALLSGMMNEEDLSSDSAQFRLMYKFGSPLELDRFLADSKALLKGNEEFVVIFDLLTALHETFHSFKGDILYQLDYAKNALALLAEKSRELSKLWKDEFHHHSSGKGADFYGLFPFFDASCSIFPPKEPILDLESVDVLVHLSEEVVPVLERFLTTIESLNGTALMVFFFRCQFHVKADAFKRIALANWMKHLYEYHLASTSPSLFAFPWPSEQMSLEDLNSIVVVLLYFCRNASWIHRKAADFTRKVILEQLESSSISTERALILRFLFGQVYLKRLELGFSLGLVTPNETEKRLSKQLLHLGIAKQQQLLPNCQLLWEYWNQLSKEYAVKDDEEKLDLSKLDSVVRRRFHLDLLEEMWRMVE